MSDLRDLCGKFLDANMNHYLIETSWLADHLNEPGIRIVDARWRGDGSSRELYLAGHIPGAVPIDWHLDLSHTSHGVRDIILPPERFASAMAQAGIGDGTAVIAYAETDYSGAARLWWALRYYGHDRIAVLNGGITKWVAEGKLLSREVPTIQQAAFTPRPRPDLLASKAEILAVLQRPEGNTAILDTRPAEQYHGQAVWTPQGSLYLPPGRDEVDAGGRKLRGGHIPGAASLPSTGNLDPGAWTFLDGETLRARAAGAGLLPGKRVIAYCGVGISASLGLFALHLAGYQDLALYDASWEEWGYDPDLPIERSNSTPVTRALASLGIPHRLFRHPGPVHSLEQAARERGQRPEQVVRSILFRLSLRSRLRLSQDEFVMVLVAGPAQVSWPALRAYLGQSRLTMASEAEVLAATGYPLGAVSPFGLPTPLRILVDQSVLGEEEISIGSGERYATVILKATELMKALSSAEVGDFLSGGGGTSG